MNVTNIMNLSGRSISFFFGKPTLVTWVVRFDHDVLEKKEKNDGGRMKNGVRERTVKERARHMC